MRSFLLLAVFVTFILNCTSRFAFADNVDHFRNFKIPPDEARILALTDVREFRCNYEVNPSDSAMVNQGAPLYYQEDLDLFAELYEGTSCVGRYRLTVAVNAFNDLKIPLKGIVSFGWNKEKHELVSVIDNEQFYSPWSASLVLKDFYYSSHFFFENSAPEKRHSDSGTSDFNIYPVVGICGDRRIKMNDIGFTDVASYLKTCEHSGAKNVLVIYLYKTSGGEAPLHFNPSP